MKRRRKSNNPDGRPSNQLAEAAVLVRGPAELLDAVRDAAAAEGVTVAEWWRRAARARLDGQAAVRAQWAAARGA